MGDRQEQNTQKTKNGFSFDYTLLLIVLFLVCMGLVMLYSTSAYNGEVKFGDPAYYVKNQTFATTLGIAAMLIIARIDYHVWSGFAIPAYLVSVLLSVAVLLFGDEYNGSRRWLHIGPVSFQPSEFCKVAIIVFLAFVVTKSVKK